MTTHKNTPPDGEVFSCLQALVRGMKESDPRLLFWSKYRKEFLLIFDEP
ncbi:MAG: hypothetical protein UT41_C0001G0164 [Candidatus Wolfebacteria bacterium GW2011_GWC2_39_22]|uniref:Uncharacterized protein n=1 Tax=Candidatus Wolfebacteria bacterium GW2011_GWC2_39_22 TaxID=1619013 RepID=A0A0G0QQH3_9BACT|nr:MAG: hypothetical protein UT41_C0001G0164 [Candidatus Wolfebacteria bacterium GW2011_GWC2_39_22]